MSPTFGQSVRVLICIDALGIGGKERQAVELIKGLASAGPDINYRVVCFDTADFYLADLNTAGVAVDFLPRRARWDVGVFRRLYRLIASYEPNVIHTNGLISSFYAWPIAKARGVPLVNGSIRNAFVKGGLRWTLERALLALSDFRVANSYAGLRSRGFSEHSPGNLVIYNGFDFARIDRLIVTAPEGRAGRDGVSTIGMVAEFNRFKDYFTFIEAARILSRKGRRVLFVTVGDGETLNACRAAADGLDCVRFLGKRKDVEEIVRTFDVGVLSTFVEGLSNSIMEYMALGKPVVATDGGGTRELVVHGETGLLVPPTHATALAAAIELLIEHPDLADRFGRAGQAKLRREFSLTQMIDRTVALYRRAAFGIEAAVPADVRESVLGS